MASKSSTKAATASANGEDTRSLRKPHRQVLGTLVKAGPKASLSRRTIATRVEAAGDSLINGRIAAETNTYHELETWGYVTGNQLGGPGEEVNEYAYTITAAGRKALDDAKAVKKTTTAAHKDYEKSKAAKEGKGKGRKAATAAE